jgi:hypothetical protein
VEQKLWNVQQRDQVEKQTKKVANLSVLLGPIVSLLNLCSKLWLHFLESSGLKFAELSQSKPAQ